MATTRQAGASAPQTPLQAVLAQVVGRLRLVRRLRLAVRGVLIAALLALLCVGLAHWGLLPVWLPLEVVLPILLLSGAGLGTLAADARPVDAFSAAQAVEERLGLKERLSSALEFERSAQTVGDPEAALLLRLQQEDAAAHARALRPDDAAPLRLPWEAKALIPTLLLLLLALILPALPVFVPPGIRAERGVVQKSGEVLSRAARVIEKRADAQGAPETKEAARKMRLLGQEMAQGRMDKKQAMVQMGRLSRQMADAQKRLAQTGDDAAPTDKDLTQAGRELERSLQPSGSDGQTTGAKNGAASGQRPSSPDTNDPKMRAAARALKQDDASGLGRQLRAMAQRTPESPDEQHRVAQDLKRLSEALKGTPLSEAQKRVQNAADAMTHGDPRRAADEMRHAADAADRQAAQQQDAQGVRDARQSLQDSEQKMAQAVKPADLSHGEAQRPAAPGKSGAAPPQAQGQSGQGRRPASGQGRQAGSGRGDRPDGGAPGPGGRQGGASGLPHGGGGSAPSAAGMPMLGAGGTGAPHGAPHPLDARFDPTRSPKYAKIYLGAGSGTGGGGKTLSAGPGAQTPGKPGVGSVPYYDTLAPARKSAETAMDREDVPPAYRSGVRRYFDALPPAPAKTAR